MALMLVLAVGAALMAPESAPMDGHWRLAWPCGAEGCPGGISDYFELDLWSEGDRLCGTHAATAHAGNRVDEDEDWTPSLAGQIKGGSALVRFHSHWGAWGHARIQVHGAKLTWKVLDQDGGESWMPHEAELTRAAVEGRKPPAVCSGKVG